MSTKGMALVFLIVMVVLVGVVLVPLGVIWAINTLFPAAAIPQTLDAWFAMLLILAVLSARAAK